MYIVTYTSHNPENRGEKLYWKADAETGMKSKAMATRFFDNLDAQAVAEQYRDGDVEQVDA